MPMNPLNQESNVELMTLGAVNIDMLIPHSSAFRTFGVQIGGVQAGVAIHITASLDGVVAHRLVQHATVATTDGSGNCTFQFVNKCTYPGGLHLKFSNKFAGTAIVIMGDNPFARRGEKRDS